MIVIKTEMKRIPECCWVCTKYVTETAFGAPSCMAKAGRQRFCGKPLDGVKTSRERPAWCPLAELRMDDGGAYAQHG